MAKKMKIVKLPNGLIDWKASFIPRIDFNPETDITFVEPKEEDKS